MLELIQHYVLSSADVKVIVEKVCGWDLDRFSSNMNNTQASNDPNANAQWEQQPGQDHHRQVENSPSPTATTVRFDVFQLPAILFCSSDFDNSPSLLPWANCFKKFYELVGSHGIDLMSTQFVCVRLMDVNVARYISLDRSTATAGQDSWGAVRVKGFDCVTMFGGVATKSFVFLVFPTALISNLFAYISYLGGLHAVEIAQGGPVQKPRARHKKNQKVKEGRVKYIPESMFFEKALRVLLLFLLFYIILTIMSNLKQSLMKVGSFLITFWIINLFK